MADTDSAAASLEGVSESGASDRAGSLEPSLVGPGIPTLAGGHPGGSIAELVASRRTGSASANAEAAAAPPVEGVREQVAEPTAEGLTLNVLAAQLLDLRSKYEAQEAERMESRQIKETQRGEIEQLNWRVSELVRQCALDRKEGDAARSQDAVEPVHPRAMRR